MIGASQTEPTTPLEMFFLISESFPVNLENQIERAEKLRQSEISISALETKQTMYSKTGHLKLRSK